MAHTYNPSYSGGRDKADHSLKLAWANGSQGPILKNPITKNWAGGVTQAPVPKNAHARQAQRPKFKCLYCLLLQTTPQNTKRPHTHLIQS
jgi:hypothetical protein